MRRWLRVRTTGGKKYGERKFVYKREIVVVAGKKIQVACLAANAFSHALLVHEFLLVLVEAGLPAALHALAGVILGQPVLATKLVGTKSTVPDNDNGPLAAAVHSAAALLALSAAKAKDQVEGRLLLDVVVGQGATVFQLLAGEDQALLIGGNAFLVLDLLFDVLDGVGALHFQGDGFAGKGLDEDLHTTAETKDQVEGGLLLDVVVGQGTAVLQLLAGEDQALLVRGNAFLVLDLLLHVLDGVGALHLQSDCLTSEGLDEDLHCVEFWCSSGVLVW
ncbi:Ubiquitin/40s ribosomal protein s27a fusion [Balamuthia mandrillaris]